jgi:hypothetical protein
MDTRPRLPGAPRSKTRTAATRCGYALANRYRLILAIQHMPSWRWIGLKASGGDETLRAPVGARVREFNERTVRIKDSALERHGLFRCGAFGAACVAVHRSNVREWHPPRPE